MCSLVAGGRSPPMLLAFIIFLPFRFRRRDLDGVLESFLPSSFLFPSDFWSLLCLPSFFDVPLGAPYAASFFGSALGSTSGMLSSSWAISKSKSSSSFRTEPSNFASVKSPSIEVCNAWSWPSYKVRTQLSGPIA
jgi:hypothetical protein